MIIPPFFEFEPISLDSLGLTNEEIDLIDKLNQDNVPLFKVGRHTLTATHYVGIVQINDKIIQVLPKIDYQSKEGTISKEISANRNLLFMLAYANQIPIKVLDTIGIKSQKANWFELLTFFFASELIKQFRSGIYRSYTLFEDRLPMIKGKWMFSRQAIRWGYDRTKFDVSYDEFSENNLLNQIFKYVIDRLIIHSTDTSNRRLLRELQLLLSGVDSPTMLPKADIDSFHLSRLNERFSVSLNFARLFINHMALEMASGKTKLFAFMLDMNQLFQDFVFEFVRKHKDKIFLEDSLVAITSQAKGHNYRFLNQEYPQHKEVIRLKPDIVIYDQNNLPLMIVDTKYERLDENHKRLPYREQNFYQMFAYSEIVNCPKILLLFPKNDLIVRDEFRVIEHNAAINVATIDLHHPMEDPASMISEFQNIFQVLFTKQEVNNGTQLRR